MTALRLLPQPEPEKRPDQQLWDALDAHLWPVCSPGERGRRNGAIKQMLRSEPPVTPDEIPMLVEAWRRIYPYATGFTEHALVNHLGQLRRFITQPEPAPSRRQQQRVAEAREMFDWRDR